MPSERTALIPRSEKSLDRNSVPGFLSLRPVSAIIDEMSAEEYPIEKLLR
jgi:hypothetical protein